MKNRSIEIMKVLQEKGYTLLDVINLMVDISSIQMESIKMQPSSSSSSTISLEDWITQKLMELGIPAHIKGFCYGRTAIIALYQNPDQLMVKELFPNVAKIHNTTWSRVERAIRHAIEVGMYRGNLEKIFQEKPTCAQFLYTMVEIIKKEYGK